HHGRARGRDQPRDPSRHGGIGPPARLRGVAPAHRRLVRLTWRCHPVTKVATWLRKQTAGVVALALMLAVFVAGRPTFASDEVKDRKSTRLNSSHVKISYAVLCLKKKNLAQAFIELAEAVIVDLEHRIFCLLGAALVQGIVEPAARQSPIGEPGEADIILKEREGH